MTGQLPGAVPDRALFIAVFYCGPWERVAARLHALDRDTDELIREIRAGSIRDRAATWFWQLDDRWRYRYAVAGTEPPARWRRRDPQGL